jgi:hypothetical protein
MSEYEETRARSPFERNSSTLEGLHDEQEQIRAACAEQRRRALSMREQAAELRAQSRRLWGRKQVR